MKPKMKFGFFESKSGKIEARDVYDENDKLLGKYTGEIKNGFMSGNGKLTLANGEYFEGVFKENEIEYGKYKKNLRWRWVIFTGSFLNFQEHGEGEVKEYENGEVEKTSVWKGSWFKGKMHGKFLIDYSNISKSGGIQEISTEVSFSNDKIQGDIIHIYDNGTKYIGQGTYRRGDYWITREGFGVCYYKTENSLKYNNKDCFFGDNGFVYEGNWVLRKRDGKGILKDSNGKIIVNGEWDFNKLINGYLETVEIYACNSEYPERKLYFSSYYDPEIIKGEYKGQIKNKLKHGKGITKFESGEFYEGNYKDGRKHGLGKYVYENGSLYEGNWNENLKAGFGEITWTVESTYYPCKKGYRYKGNWTNDKFYGEGVLYNDANEIIASGEWENNQLKSGICKDFKFLPEGEVKLLKIKRFDAILEYTGEIKKFNIEGKGSATYESGETYEGYWVKNQRSGNGKNSYSNGNVYEGEWAENTPHGNGEMYYQVVEDTFLAKSGSKYSGDWDYGLMHGKGSLITYEGKIYQGIFSKNTFIEGTLSDKEGTIIQKGFWINETCITSQVEKYVLVNDYGLAIAEYQNYLNNPFIIDLPNEINVQNAIKKELEKLEALEKEFKIKDILNSFKNNTSPNDDFDDFE
jgi:hypothetical protein